MKNNNSKLPEKLSKDYLIGVLHTIDDKISDDDLQKILDVFKLQHYEKNKKIINEGEITNHLYFIFKGLVRVYYYKSGKELIDWFAEEGYFFGNLYSYILQKPGIDIYETMEETIVLKASYADLQSLYKESHEIDSLARRIMELYYVKYVERVHNIKGLPAEEKYEAFLKNYESCSNRIPLKFVANYLGITSETISRIRAR